MSLFASQPGCAERTQLPSSFCSAACSTSAHRRSCWCMTAPRQTTWCWPAALFRLLRQRWGARTAAEMAIRKRAAPATGAAPMAVPTAPTEVHSPPLPPAGPHPLAAASPQRLWQALRPDTAYPLTKRHLRTTHPKHFLYHQPPRVNFLTYPLMYPSHFSNATHTCLAL